MLFVIILLIFLGKAIEIVEKKEVPVPAYRRRGRTDAAQREYAQNVRRLEEQELNGRLELLNLNEIDQSEIDSTLTGSEILFIYNNTNVNLFRPKVEYNVQL